MDRQEEKPPSELAEAGNRPAVPKLTFDSSGIPDFFFPDKEDEDGEVAINGIL